MEERGGVRRMWRKEKGGGRREEGEGSRRREEGEGRREREDGGGRREKGGGRRGGKRKDGERSQRRKDVMMGSISYSFPLPLQVMHPITSQTASKVQWIT